MDCDSASQNNISWAYYLSEGQEPDCENDAPRPPMLLLVKPGVSGAVSNPSAVSASSASASLNAAKPAASADSTGNDWIRQSD